VVDLHGQRIEVRFQGGLVVGQGGEFVSHNDDVIIELLTN
jgi:hypothetical protein